jgi:hypothetical protein
MLLRGMQKGRKCGSNREGGGYSCLFKKIVKYFVQWHVFAKSPPGQSSNDKYPVKNFYSSQFVKHVSIVVLFEGSNGNSYTVSAQSDVCQEKEIKQKKMGQQ